MEAIASYAELRARAAQELPERFDPHRPYVDEIVLTCACGGAMAREPEVIDVWYDSGAMPFAQEHHPIATGGDLAGRFPADFICEALDQTRGWFYSLLAESTLLFDEAAYRNVVCLGLMLDAEGQKMSKSKGNVIEPWTVLDRQGADAFRWYLLTAQSPWDSFRFSLEAVDEAMRRFLLTLWNTFSFLVTYAALPDGWSPADGAAEAARRPIDRWVLSRLDGAVEEVTERLEGYDATGAGRALEGFLDDLSNWYVRTSRRRFWGGRAGRTGSPAATPAQDAVAAFATLHECLATLTLLVAPFCPFVAEEMYGDPGRRPRPRRPRERAPGRLAGAAGAPRPRARGRHGGGPRGGGRGPGRARRGPPQGAPAAGRGGGGRAGRAGPLDRGAGRPRGRGAQRAPGALRHGPRGAGRGDREAQLPPPRPALRQADAGRSPRPSPRCRPPSRRAPSTPATGSRSPSTATGSGWVPRTCCCEARPSEGYAVGQDAALAVGLATEITPDLRREALAREVVHAVQGARRAAGLRVEERIHLHLDGSGALREAIEEHRDAIAGETLATRLTVGHGAPFAGLRHEEHVIDGEPLALRLERAAA